MDKITWCIDCKKELAGSADASMASASIFGFGTSTPLYCQNPKCKRYGLATVMYLKPQSEAPETAIPSDPNLDKDKEKHDD